MLRFTCLGMLCLCVMATTQAKPIPINDAIPLIAKVTQETEESILINVANLQNERTVIEINDLDNSTSYFRKSFKGQNGESLLLNLRKLDNGRYRINIRQGDTEKTAVLLKRNGKIMVSKVR